MSYRRICQLDLLLLKHYRDNPRVSSSIFTPSSFSKCSSSAVFCTREERHYSTSPLRKPSVKTHYELLNVNSMATTQEIREAFLKLSKECHPDLNMDDPEKNHLKFVAVNEAYMVLSKHSSRRDYDLTLQVEKHLRQQSNYPAYRSYGYQADAPHYHYRHQSHVDWDGASSSQSDEKFHSGKRLHRMLVNFYSLTVVFTVGFVALIIGSRDYILPALPRKTVIRKETDFNKHSYIMKSLHEGQTVLYYAVPDDDNDNPESFKVHAFLKKEVDGNPNEYVLEELNSV